MRIQASRRGELTPAEQDYGRGGVDMRERPACGIVNPVDNRLEPPTLTPDSLTQHDAGVGALDVLVGGDGPGDATAWLSPTLSAHSAGDVNGYVRERDFPPGSERSAHVDG